MLFSSYQELKENKNIPLIFKRRHVLYNVSNRWHRRTGLTTIDTKIERGLWSCWKILSLKNMLIQGADDKLGQFLGQDIEASANHRNVLRPSLESYSSLVSRNVSKPSLVTKICRQSTKLLQLFKKLCAPSIESTGDWKVSKNGQVPGLPFKDSFEPKPGYWGGRCHSCPKLTQKRAFDLMRTVDFVAWPPKTQPKSPRTGWRLKDHWSGNLASQL